MYLNIFLMAIYQTIKDLIKFISSQRQQLQPFILEFHKYTAKNTLYPELYA